MRTWFHTMVVAATLVAAPCLAADGDGDWADTLFGTGGNTESGVKSTTADPPKPEAPATAPVVKGDKGDKGDAGEAGLKGDRGNTGAQGPAAAKAKSGRNGATGKDGKPGRDGRDSKLTDYPGTATDLWSYRNGGTKDQRVQWECIREAKRRDVGETRMRQEADKDVRRKAKEGGEKFCEELVTTTLLLILLTAAAFFCAAAAQRRD